jgi:hypothetical protein
MLILSLFILENPGYHKNLVQKNNKCNALVINILVHQSRENGHPEVHKKG